MKQHSRVLLAAIAVAALAACASAPTAATFRGQPVKVLSGMSMNCAEPYALTRDCSASGGARMRVRAGQVVVRVAGTADGRTIVVMSEAAIPSQPKSEEAAMAVQALVAPIGAQLVKVEALSSLGGTITGYVMQFDRDVYNVLRDNSLTG